MGLLLERRMAAWALCTLLLAFVPSSLGVGEWEGTAPPTPGPTPAPTPAPIAPASPDNAQTTGADPDDDETPVIPTNEEPQQASTATTSGSRWSNRERRFPRPAPAPRAAPARGADVPRDKYGFREDMWGGFWEARDSGDPPGTWNAEREKRFFKRLRAWGARRFAMPSTDFQMSRMSGEMTLMITSVLTEIVGGSGGDCIGGNFHLENGRNEIEVLNGNDSEDQDVMYNRFRYFCESCMTTHAMINNNPFLDGASWVVAAWSNPDSLGFSDTDRYSTVIMSDPMNVNLNVLTADRNRFYRSSRYDPNGLTEYEGVLKWIADSGRPSNFLNRLIYTCQVENQPSNEQYKLNPYRQAQAKTQAWAQEPSLQVSAIDNKSSNCEMAWVLKARSCAEVADALDEAAYTTNGIEEVQRDGPRWLLQLASGHRMTMTVKALPDGTCQAAAHPEELPAVSCQMQRMAELSGLGFERVVQGEGCRESVEECGAEEPALEWPHLPHIEWPQLPDVAGAPSSQEPAPAEAEAPLCDDIVWHFPLGCQLVQDALHGLVVPPSADTRELGERSPLMHEPSKDLFEVTVGGETMHVVMEQTTKGACVMQPRKPAHRQLLRSLNCMLNAELASTALPYETLNMEEGCENANSLSTCPAAAEAAAAAQNLQAPEEQVQSCHDVAFHFTGHSCNTVSDELMVIAKAERAVKAATLDTQNVQGMVGLKLASMPDGSCLAVAEEAIEELLPQFNCAMRKAALGTKLPFEESALRDGCQVSMDHCL
ncbi:unnamed protein product [Chrysoparadoxa australica]